jgi:hypothetical protein
MIVTGPETVLQWLPRFSIVLSQTQLRSGGSTICAGYVRFPGSRLNRITALSSDSIPAVSDGLLPDQWFVFTNAFFRNQPAFSPAYAGEISKINN